MRLTEASVAIRPRSSWEALDLGVLLARRHAGLLMASWALVTLPIFALLCLIFWDYPSIAIFVFWWLKPAYERLPLHILSNSLFGNTPTLKQALKAYPRLLKPQLLASLTWRRISTTRSFDMPVMQLEGLSGAARSQRLTVLGHKNSSGATWLTIVGAHVELALSLGLATLFYLMLPQQLELDWSWQSLIAPEQNQWMWLEHLSNGLYALLLIVWEPVYVACGFSLYLNRRTALEAWDIELVFRQLRQRLTGIAYAALLAAGLLFSQLPDTAMADTGKPDSAVSIPAKSAASPPVISAPADPLGPQAERLQKQALSSEAARHSLQQLLDKPPFKNPETVTRWRLRDDASDKQTKPDTEFLESLIAGLGKLGKLWKSMETLAQVFAALLWAALLALILWVLWRYRDWLNTFAGRFGLPQRLKTSPPSQLFGLEVSPESLPDDICSEVDRLWAQDPRAALSLLYRALLSRLLHDYRIGLKSAHTEQEVLQLVEDSYQPELYQFSDTLTRHWQNLAYGHNLPPVAAKASLCDSWRQLFESRGKA
ncbi:DUF4129 domain-containing protein [Pseudomonas sp. EL_65y_Pfl2_R95]|uniref:DUF4129 domain-containing protein n=1 Tax=Pseudomonas sp. EL_65y_Pfl2_R95 TaxID=3088698 RepID=UPI0030D88A0A